MAAYDTRKIRRKIDTLETELAAGARYALRGVNRRAGPCVQDWKGNTGHPLWMRNHMIPVKRRVRAQLDRALDTIATKERGRRLRARRRAGG
jgi:hypothetical protein